MSFRPLFLKFFKWMQRNVPYGYLMYESKQMRANKEVLGGRMKK